MRSRRPPPKLDVVVAQTVLTVFAVLFAAPLVVMVLVSLEGSGLGNYLAVLQQPLVPRFFLNSAIVASCTVAAVYVVTILGAYGFSRLVLPGKALLFNSVLIGLMIPTAALLVPLFIVVLRLRLVNNYAALILPYTALAVPFTILLTRNFMNGLPNELFEAARIDGANTFRTLLSIVLPISRAISIVVVIWTFLTSWNEYFLALVFMRSDMMGTITQAPQFFTSTYSQDTGKVFAALVLISLPIVAAYLALQRYFEDGLTSGIGKS